MTTIATEYQFSSAHFLPLVPESHKCKRVHGHNYVLRVIIEGDTRPDGMLMDFFNIDAVAQPLVDELDHRLLNDIPGLENPTAEIIAQWFATRLCGTVGSVVRCRVYETPNCYAEVEVVL